MWSKNRFDLKFRGMSDQRFYPVYGCIGIISLSQCTKFFCLFFVVNFFISYCTFVFGSLINVKLLDYQLFCKVCAGMEYISFMVHRACQHTVYQEKEHISLNSFKWNINLRRLSFLIWTKATQIKWFL